MIIERWDASLAKDNVTLRITGVGYLLWSYIGILIIIGPLVAQYKAIHSMNDVARSFNKTV